MKHKIIKGLPISALTLGTVQLGMDYGIANKQGRPDEETSSSILKTALDRGICSFDTARAYGQSEEVLGTFFKDREKPLLITKVRLDFDKNTTHAELEERMHQSVQTSISHLQMNRLPLLMLHHPAVLEDHATSMINIVKSMKQEGFVDKVGVSFGANTDEQFATIWDVVQDDLFEAVQVPVNILDHRLFHNGGFQKLKDTHKIVFARSIFLQGALFIKENELPEHLVEASQPLKILQEISQKSGLSIAQLAVSFIRDLDEVHSLVIGIERTEQLTSTLELMEGPELSAHIRQECMDRLAHVPEKIVNTLLW